MPQRLMSFVLADDPISISSADLINALREQFDPQGCDAHSLASAKDQGQACILSVDGVALIVTFADFRVPGGTLERAVQLSWMWPGAGEAVSKHRSHAVIVTMQAPEKHADILMAAAAVTRVALVLAKKTSALGVYWESADLLVSAEAFREQARSFSLEMGQTPASLWVNFTCFPGRETDELGVVTKGLLPFTGRELEFTPKRLPHATMLSKAFGVTQWLLAQGPTINDGDTCGSSTQEVIRIKYRDRGLIHTVPVLQLEIEQTA